MHLHFLHPTRVTFALILIINSCQASGALTRQLLIPKSFSLGGSHSPTGHTTQDTSSNNSNNAESDVADPKIKKKSFINFRFMESFYKNLLTVFVTDPDTLRIIAKACSWITWAFIILSAFGTFGFDTKPLLSLLSVSGLTVGFAAKDILTNMFKGFFILLTKPFKRGWIISVNGFRGKVISIDSRFVKLESFVDKSEILVPLSMIYDTAIVVERKGDI